MDPREKLSIDFSILNGNPTVEWTVPPKQLRFSKNEIHLWRVELDSARLEDAEIDLLLTHDERERAKRFKFEQHRLRFQSAHVALRVILAEYVGIAPRAIAFDHGPAGKPFLPGNPVFFNMSHSHNLALIAVRSDGPVGVDVEWIDPALDIENMPTDKFDSRDIALLNSTEARLRPAKFYQLWTAMEARLKREGTGLVGTTTVDPSVRIHELIPATGFVAAVAI